MKEEKFKSSTSNFTFTMAQENLLRSMRITNYNDKKLYNVGNVRGIGITTALVEFCKQNGYTLIVPNSHTENILKQEHCYGEIFSQSKIRQIIDRGKCIVDTCVDLDLVRQNCNIIGGVVDLNGYKKYGDDLKNNKTENKKSTLIEVLDNEVQELIKKINKAREADNYGTYKNLILSLTEVMRLKDKESEKDWKLMYSEYRDDNGKKQVSVWEQNGDGQIRNHKVWNVEEDIEYNNVTIKAGSVKLDENALKEIMDYVDKTYSERLKRIRVQY